MRNVLAIDPGTTESAYCMYDMSRSEIWEAGKIDNFELISALRKGTITGDVAVIEMVASYGMPVGKTTFETCVWIGRFFEALYPGTETRLMYRSKVKMAVCGRPQAKDSNIRQALIDMFPATGGGAIPQIGTKPKPGPLYGFKSDMWAALAVAVTYQMQQRGEA